MEKLAKKYYVDDNMSCSEGLLLSGCEKFGFTCTAELLNALGSFSGGCAVGNLCGAAAGGLALVGLKYGGGSIHQTPLHKEKAKEFMVLFQEEFGNTMCKELTPIYKKPEVRCLEIIEKTLDIISFVFGH